MKSEKRIAWENAFVLLVEDVDDNRELYVQFFIHKGWRVETAADGFEAVAKSASLRPDIIVMDLGLPKMDGWEAIRMIKAHPVNGEIPIIALSAHALDASKARAIAAGVDSYLTKPCLPEALLEEIARVLGHRGGPGTR
jgi:two-component system cell cycle response regulator DivK